MSEQQEFWVTVYLIVSLIALLFIAWVFNPFRKRDDDFFE